MKKAIFLLVLVSSLAALAASPDENKALADRQGALRNAFTAQMKGRQFTNALATASELMASAKGAEHPAAGRGATALFLGKAMASPLNLLLLEEAKAHLAIAVDEAPSAYDRAHARLILLALKARTDPDAEYDADVATLRALIENPGLGAADHVRFLFNAVESQNLPFGVDILGLAEKAVGTNAAARAVFYGGAIRRMSSAVQSGSLDPAVSREARLALIERALADGAIPKHSSYPALKVEALRDLGRYDEAEQYILDGAAHTNAELSVSGWYELLGKFYDEISGRYYSEPNKELVQKSVDAYRRALELSPKSGGARRELPRLLIRLGEFAAAREMIDAEIAAGKGVTNAVNAARLAGMAFAERDYAQAAALYSLLDNPDTDTREKLAKALYATGRYDACAAQLEILAKTTNNRYRRPYFKYCLDRVRAKK